MDWGELFIALVSGAVGGFASYKIQERQLRKQYQLEDSAERVVHSLLSDSGWRLRSFKVIRHHIGGFENDELRKLLVRSGGIRFMSKSGHELWGLIERNKERLGVTRIDQDPENQNDKEIFDGP